MSDLVRGHPPDGCYFLNCSTNDGKVKSIVAYYKNIPDGGNTGQQPDDIAVVTVGSLVTWETTQSK